jgi:hypothetical protein
MVGLPGPFAGLSMNCRACHLVDEHTATQPDFMRTYTDFALRSPIPDRGDGKRTAPRNSPPLVNASLDRPGGTLFHFDGEFLTLEDLIVGTFTGRNFGWLPGQKAEAIHHIAQVMRGDDGSGVIAQQFDGLSYRILFTGANLDMPNPQAKIRAILCDEHLPLACPADSVLLDEAIARFKTPGIRDLGHSGPYMHNGKFDTLDNAVGFYLGSSSSARAGTLRNGANALKGIALLPADIAPLVAFLKSLNEDYQ